MPISHHIYELLGEEELEKEITKNGTFLEDQLSADQAVYR